MLVLLTRLLQILSINLPEHTRYLGRTPRDPLSTKSGCGLAWFSLAWFIEEIELRLTHTTLFGKIPALLCHCFRIPVAVQSFVA